MLVPPATRPPGGSRNANGAANAGAVASPSFDKGPSGLLRRGFLVFLLAGPALACQGLFLEQGVGVEGFELEGFFLHHRHVLAARLALGLVLGAGDIEA